MVLAVDDFLQAFNELEKKLQEYFNSEDGIYNLLNRARAESTINPVKANWEALDVARELRNLLVHNTTSELPNIASPSKELIDILRNVVTEYHAPKTVGQFVQEYKQEPLKSFFAHDRLEDALHVIKTRGFSQFPIFNGKEYLGVLSRDGIANWMANHIQSLKQHHTSIANTTLYDVIQFEGHHENVTRIYKEDSLYKLVAIFEEKDVRAVLVCENQALNINRVDDIATIITKYDVVRIYRALKMGQDTYELNAN